MRVSSCWILEHVHLTSCLALVLSGEQCKILYTANKVAFQQNVKETATFCKSFVTGQSNNLQVHCNWTNEQFVSPL